MPRRNDYPYPRRVTEGRRRGLHAAVVHELGSRIAEGRINPGDTLVPDEIGRRYGVSRTVVREAFRVLEAKGMVSARPNVGTRARPSAEWNLLDPDVIDWRAHGPQRREQFRELLELREAIEPYAAQRAAGRKDPEAIARLTVVAGEMERSARARNVDGFTEADIEFHHTLLRAGGNHMIEQLIATVAVALRVRHEQLTTVDDISDTAVALHRDIAVAVAAGDPAEAARSVRLLLAESRWAIERVLERWQPH